MSVIKRFARPRLSLLLISAVLATAAQAQVVGYNFRTGDAWVDTRLVEINDYGSRYRDPFIDEMTGYYGAPRSLVNDLFGRRWSAGDIYYACAIAHILGVPCINVVHEYERNPGQGWGALAKRMGIKPGSRQFHDLKNGFSRTYDRWGYPVAVDRNVHVDWSQHGPGKGKGGGNAGKPSKQTSPSAQGNKGHADHGQGKAKGNNGNNGKGKDKGK
ncbi:hypothetical protein [Pseudoxanthomonas indica]|uniref:Transglycosylase SLT domain-containing protein n=1 Tax=Pseudoxanthomonas indica TaxID=428993 RepID=A0A1T5JMU3_9GAMM|nr:hypothetical protein [Pseudoxanthomonas indica]GGD43246.1 hypothetical protein GCM10007235_14020 [Pseudoxanthomonas indica]SKC52709.1 hypothetical protein SAMN06296058_0941 [Pseudoxanthomonas indica]